MSKSAVVKEETLTKEGLEGQIADLPSTKIRTPAGDAWREFKRNRFAVLGLSWIIIVVVSALIAPVVTPYDYATQNTGYPREHPMTGVVLAESYVEKNCHWADTPFEWGCTIYLFGSDGLGRDLWSRVVYGSRVSLSVAIVASTVALVLGTVIGTASGYFGGVVDNVTMRFVDFLYAVPLLPIIILMQVYFQALTRSGASEGIVGVLIEANKASGGLLFLFVALGVLNWIGMARLARGQVLSYKNKEFVEAARAVGSSDRRIIFKHLLPNVFGPLLVAETLAIPGYIFTEAVLSFIGLGVSPPTPSWGAMISDGYTGIQSRAYLVLLPGIALTSLTLAFNFFGDGLRDAFDPKTRGRF